MQYKINDLINLYGIKSNIESEIAKKENRSIVFNPYERDKAELITCKEASRLYPIGEQKFRVLCRSTNKNFPSIKVGCRYYIVKNKLDEWFIKNAIGETF